MDIDQKIDKLAEKIETKLDKVIETANRQEVHLGELTVSVTEHVRRSNLLEAEQKDIKKDLEPIKKHVAVVSALMKILSLLVAGGVVTELIHIVMRR